MGSEARPPDQCQRRRIKTNLKNPHVRSRLPAAIVLALLAAGAVVAWRLMSCADCAVPYGVCRTDVTGMRIWYPTSEPARLTQLWSKFRMEPHCHDAALAQAEQPFPVLLYFGGWPGTEVNNVELIQALVETGYVVATRIYPPSSERPMDFSSQAAYEDTLLRADKQVRALAGDATTLVDRLIALNAGQPASVFSGRLATTEIGILGYSFGGAVAAQAAWTEPRIKAVLNIDGWSFGDAAVHGVRQPYLMISDDTPIPGPADLTSADLNHRFTSWLTKQDFYRLLHNFPLNGGVFVTVRGTQHADFSDRGRRSRWRDALGLPADRAGRVQMLLRTYTVTFFQGALRRIKSPLLEGPSAQFPEAQLRRWDGTKEGGA